MSALDDAFQTELLAYCALWDDKGIETKSIRRGIEDYDGAVATAAWCVMNDTKDSVWLSTDLVAVRRSSRS